MLNFFFFILVKMFVERCTYYILKIFNLTANINTFNNIYR